MVNYIDPQKAFEDLKETFLNIVTTKDNPRQIEGWTQATAIQALKKMNDQEILLLANSPLDPVVKMIDTAKIQEIEDRRYSRTEPDFCDADEHVERLNSRRQTLKYNKSLLNDMPQSDHIKYNRAFQMMHEHIESRFNRPLAGVGAVQLRKDMLNGLALANPVELIKILDNSALKTDKNQYLDSIADSFIYVARETRAERTEELASKDGLTSKAAAIAAVTLGTSSAIVSLKEKDYSKEHALATGLGFSAIILGLVAISQLCKQSRKFSQALEQYAQVADTVFHNKTLRNNYYTFKTKKEKYTSRTL